MTLLDTLGITTVSVSADRVEMRMPVRPEIYQPHGFLHGGATIALLESCASRAAEERTDFDKELIFGLETTIRHKKARKDGMITGVAELEREELRTAVASSSGTLLPPTSWVTPFRKARSLRKSLRKSTSPRSNVNRPKLIRSSVALMPHAPACGMFFRAAGWRSRCGMRLQVP